VSEQIDPMEEARRRIAEEAERRTGRLDLAGLMLPALPAEIGELTHLRELRCGHAEYEGSTLADLAPIASLAGLQSLDCSGTHVADLTPLAGLAALESLDCRGTKVASLAPLADLADLRSLDFRVTKVADLKPLTRLTNLQKLDCSATRVTDLVPLAGLFALRSLDCWANGVADLSPLADLKGLESLACGHTKVIDLTPLRGLTGLQRLDCARTEIAELAPLAGLIGLKSLECRGTKIADLAPLAGLARLRSINCSETLVADLAPLAGLAGLHFLDCSRTQVANLASLAGIVGLKWLYCSFTQVADLAPLEGLAALELLYCNGCELSAFPQTLLNLPALQRLALYGATISGVPFEILSKSYDDNCLDRLRAYFAARDQGGAVAMDSRLLLLGNGRVGKTQIARWLRGEAFDETVPSTHGIQLRPLDLPCLGRVQIWDFGGQDIYHGTHALFLRNPAVFTVAWARGQEPDVAPFHALDGLEFRNQPLAYWATLVGHLRHAASPVLFVQAQCDTPAEEVQPFPIPAEARDMLPWKRELHVSAKADRGREELVAALGSALRELHNPAALGVPVVGAGWLRVQRALEALREADAALPPEQRRHRWISQADFAAICAEAGDVPSPAHALGWLDASGAVFFRAGLFEDRIILDQGWALEAIYAVFDRGGCYQAIRGQGGRFSRYLLGLSVWRGFPDAEQRLLLGMMRSCGICFLHRHAGKPDEDDPYDEYIAPELLPGREAMADTLAGRWDEEAATERAVFRFPLRHPGLLRGVMAEIGGLAGADALYWNSGLCGYEAKTRSRLLIEEPEGEAESLILATQRGAAAELSDRLIRLVERVAGGLGLRAERAVPSRPLTREVADTAPALRFAQEKPAGAEWYVSYAWGDNKTPEGRDREAAVEGLCAAAAARGIRIARDRDELSLGDSISQFMRRIGAADRIFVILSEKYLRSPHCMFELHEIWRTSRQEGAAFLQRVRVLALPGTKVFAAEDWVDCAIYWKEKHEALDARARQHGAAILGELGQRRLLLMQRFYTQVTDILGTLADTVQPGTVEDLVAWAAKVS